jgi:hypothetical protein
MRVFGNANSHEKPIAVGCIVRLPWPAFNERGLTALKGITRQIVAIQFDQIGGLEEHHFVLMAIAKQIERPHAVVFANDGFAIDKQACNRRRANVSTISESGG